jgi:hypothetical protein
MLDLSVMQSVAKQMMAAGQKTVAIDGQSSPITTTSSQRLRTVRFAMNGKNYQAIEQNAEKPSRWGQLAREGHQVVQFREVASGKYVAVAVDGEVREYERP